MASFNDEMRSAARQEAGLSGRIKGGIAAAICVVGLGILSPLLVESVGPDELTVIQSPGTGKLT